VHKWHYTKTFAKLAKLDLLELQKCTNVIIALKREWTHKMGAYKELVIDIADTMFQISRDLNNASESGDFDVMKESLRRAIVNSALTIAHIQELEN
jgi:uncharacterized protein (DUF488 family)